MDLTRITFGSLLVFLFLGSAAADPILHRGVNFGDALEAAHEGQWGVVIQPDYFPAIRQAGFDTVRVPILWIAHTGPGPAYTIDPAFFRRIDWVVAQARKNNLKAILDYHYDPELMKDPDAFGGRFVAIWKQIAEHYQAEPVSILFELMNEPFGHLDSAHWNPLLARALAVIRPTNRTRTVIVGPVKWNSIGNLPTLNLPEDDHHLLVTYHFYEPMTFTHQGAGWISGSQRWLGTKWLGTDADQALLAQDIAAAAAWAQAHHRPLFMGEFGSYRTGDIDSRARWTSFVARTAESHGIPWAYWEFCAGFGVYDPVAHQWRPPLLRALIPPTTP